ncbi:transcriptional regulator [Nocardioides sp. CF8]|uniref:ROK family protein n=1 Tax=Nocardioides sp. CF8 TaxID=110319 RepID=UPI000330EFFE|nr:ROK family protein [Nocardioides sp. CF8]EON22551.1 transcriptional regulator [Nocardioides sp. CF8]
MKSENNEAAAIDHWGLDIGGTSWRLCRRTENVIVTAASGSTHVDPAKTLEDIRSSLRLLRHPTRLGCAFAGGVDDAGVVDGWPNRPSWVGFSLRRALMDASGATVHIADDGVAAALAVQRLRLAGDHDAYLVTTWGTGLGGAAVVGDRVLRPQRAGGRTLGHLPGLDPVQRCRCGSFGCLQTAWSRLGDDNETSGPWAEGVAVGTRLVELAQALGLQALVAVGGLLGRSCVRDLLHDVANRREFPILIPPQPESVPGIGATYIGQAP